MFSPVRLWHWYTEPPKAVNDPEVRRRSHFLLSILAVLWVIWAIMVLSLPLAIMLAQDDGSRRYVSTVFPMVLLALAAQSAVVSVLTRRGHYSAAARLLTAEPALVAFGGILISGNLHLFGWPIASIVLCSVLLPSLDTIATFLIVMAGYLIAPGVIAGVTSLDVSGAMIVATVIGSLSLVATIFRARDRAQIVEQSAELARNQSRLHDAKKMEAIARLSSGIASEFSRIVTSVRADAQLIEDSGGGAAPKRAKSIRHAAERAGRLTDSLLSFSEQQTLHPAIVDIDKEMRKHEQILKSLVRKNITVLLRPSPESKFLRVDAEHFCQAIQTLVRKTQETIPGSGTIVVETRIADLPRGDGISLPAGAYCAIIIGNSASGRSENRRKPHIRTVLYHRGIRDRRP